MPDTSQIAPLSAPIPAPAPAARPVRPPMTIAVLVARYSISGVPLAQVRLARALAAEGHRVTILFGYADPERRPAPIPGVELRVWNKPKARGLLRPLMRLLRRDRPDVVFSAEDHLNVLVLIAALLTGSKTKISVSSRVTPLDTYSNRPLTKRWVLKQLTRLTARRADALTCVSQDMVDQYRTMFGTGDRHQAIYNIVDDADNRARRDEPVDEPWFAGGLGPVAVAAGSLQPWKGFADAIDAIALIRDQGRALRLLILGEGPERATLEAQIARLGLRNRVRLIGHVDNSLKYFARADLFVLSSHVEGLPNVLVEALMCGTAVVATDCPTGPREVLADGRFGRLVPMRDPAALAAGMIDALDYPIDPALAAEAVRPFGAATILDQHFQSLGL